MVYIYRRWFFHFFSSVDIRDKYMDPNKSHWKDETLEGRSHFRTLSEPAVLTIDHVTETDAGIYRCRVDFRKSPTRNTRLNLTVIGKCLSGESVTEKIPRRCPISEYSTVRNAANEITGRVKTKSTVYDIYIGSKEVDCLDIRESPDPCGVFNAHAIRKTRNTIKKKQAKPHSRSGSRRFVAARSTTTKIVTTRVFSKCILVAYDVFIRVGHLVRRFRNILWKIFIYFLSSNEKKNVKNVRRTSSWKLDKTICANRRQQFALRRGGIFEKIPTCIFRMQFKIGGTCIYRC